MGNHALHQRHPESVADEGKYCHTALLRKPPLLTAMPEKVLQAGVWLAVVPMLLVAVL